MRAAIHALHSLHRRVHALTWDNGSELTQHRLIDLAAEARSYFA